METYLLISLTGEKKWMVRKMLWVLGCGLDVIGCGIGIVVRDNHSLSLSILLGGFGSEIYNRKIIVYVEVKR